MNVLSNSEETLKPMSLMLNEIGQCLVINGGVILATEKFGCVSSTVPELRLWKLFERLKEYIDPLMTVISCGSLKLYCDVPG